MLVERCPNCCIFRFPYPILQSFDPTAYTKGSGGYVGSYPWLIVVESQATRSIQHAKDLQNVAVTGVAMKLVPFERLASVQTNFVGITCSVEAQHKSLPAGRTNTGSKGWWSWLFLHDHS